MAKRRKRRTSDNLDQVLQGHVDQLESLISRRRSLQEEIATLDEEIRSVAGSFGGGSPRSAGKSKVVAKPKGRRRRAKNKVSLNDAVEAVLSKSKKGLSTADIEAAVLASGYKTTSSNFRPMIYQTLSKMKERKEVVYDSDAKLYKLTK